MCPLVVSFSGGLDSSYLLAIAIDTIGQKNVIAVTAQAPFFSPFETQYIDSVIEKTGARHIVFDHQAMEEKIFTNNPPNRCYHCKKMIFTTIKKIADKYNIHHIVHGANTDDLKEYRPGTLAAQEFGIEAPLTDAHMSKAEISIYAKDMGLANWNQPAMACLATRIPYYSVITHEKLSMIHQAECVLFNMGFSGARVRWIDRTAKIELQKTQMPDFLKGQYQDELFNQLKDIGFLDVIVSL
jgi:uncharacterized protein